MSRSLAHVVVIGGGIIGTAVTYYLGKQGVDVVLVERGDLASGTSSACSGAITMQTKGSGVKLNTALQSREMYQNLDEELGEDLEYEKDGSMIIAETEEEVKYISSLAKRQREAGVSVELLKRKQIRERQPALSACVVASTYCPLDGKINPLKVTFGFAKAAKRYGAHICTFTQVKDIQVTKGKVSAVITDCGRIMTSTVVNAAGIWAPEIGKMVGLNIPVRPRRGMLVVTEVIAPVVHGSILSAKYLLSKYAGRPRDKVEASAEGFTGGLALRHTKTGNLLFGSSREFVGYNKKTTHEGISFIVREALRVLPILRNVSFIRTFSGLRPSTLDGLPILGDVPRLKGFIMAAGHEGDGISLAPVTGKLIADLIAKGECPEELAQLNLKRFMQQILL
jgi:sarcosine oxidase subunit beta